MYTYIYIYIYMKQMTSLLRGNLQHYFNTSPHFLNQTGISHLSALPSVSATEIDDLRPLSLLFILSLSLALSPSLSLPPPHLSLPCSLSPLHFASILFSILSSALALLFPPVNCHRFLRLSLIIPASLAFFLSLT